jgi:hypothetical protein
MPFQWDITVLGGHDVNAMSTAGGRVYVYNGLAEILGANKSLWAAVIGHELAHTAQRHQTVAYMLQLQLALVYAQQRAYYQRRAALGDESAKWALLGLSIGKIAGDLVSLKLSREDEHEADHIGMLMMAEAGYHPAYVFALHRMLEIRGDKSHIGAFFSNHPRWETRVQRSHKFYEQAVARFESHWPNAVLSPGGIPPPIVFLGEPAKSQLKRNGLAVVSVPIRMEERRGQRLTAYALLMHKGRRISSSLAEYRDAGGLFFAEQVVEAAIDPVVGYEGDPNIYSAGAAQSLQLEFRLPASALPGRARKLKSRVCVATKEGIILDCTKEFKIKFPKLQ